MSLAHGLVEVTHQDNIISATFSGSFNAECVREYAIDLKAIVTSFNKQSFVMVIDNIKLQGATPEAFEELDKINVWINNFQLKAKAFIILSDIQKEIMLHRTPALSTQNIDFFTSHQEAVNWVKKFT